MMPGKTVEKTFNVVSTADDTVTYNIKFNEITNTYNEDVVFKLNLIRRFAECKPPYFLF